MLAKAAPPAFCWGSMGDDISTTDLGTASIDLLDTADAPIIPPTPLPPPGHACGPDCHWGGELPLFPWGNWVHCTHKLISGVYREGRECAHFDLSAK